MGGTKRVRVRFANQNLLSINQKIEGLKRCWFLFNPDDLETISALASHLVHKFELIDSCPNGVMLSMEGFVLPPFESTCILQDKDIIRVKRKCGVVPEVFVAGDQENRIGENEAVEKQPALPETELLAIKEFEEESEGYTSEHAEANRMSGNVSVKKKRKRSGQLCGAKYYLLPSVLSRIGFETNVLVFLDTLHTTFLSEPYTSRLSVIHLNCELLNENFTYALHPCNCFAS